MIKRLALFKFIRGTEKREPCRCSTELRSGNRTGIATYRHLYEQQDFLQLLYLERRRSERSRRPLCLILLDGSAIADPDTRERALQQLFKPLRSSTRETDIIGWYLQNSKSAIVFSDLNTADKTVIHGLRTRVSKALTAVLTPELVKRIGISVHVFPRNSDLDAGVTDYSFYPDLPRQHPAQKTAHLLKRLIDIAGSSLLLLMLCPFFAMIALLIKLHSKGPALFRQIRIGQNGKPFSFWKFRSMYVGSDTAIHREYVTKFISREDSVSQPGAVYKLINDPRVTPIGRFLRKTSLDELPQLWNVLCGEMSLVGPRPALPYELKVYALWHYRRIVDAKPGITGLWQVTARSRTTFNEMVRLDLRYAQQWSIWLDLKILLQTPKAVLTGEGAY
jgi:exopolysaccharide biosynthesis polyprenyl glycosylphosphotransferase